MKATHSPLPWSLDNSEKGKVGILDSGYPVDHVILPKVALWFNPANAALIVRAVNSHEGLSKIVETQAALQEKIFAYLNDYAAGKHLTQWSRVEPHQMLAQVYGDLAAHFGELTAARQALATATK